MSFFQLTALRQSVEITKNLRQQIITLINSSYTTAAASDTGPDEKNVFKNKRLAFKDIPAARRLPFIGTKLEYFMNGSGKM